VISDITKNIVAQKLRLMSSEAVLLHNFCDIILYSLTTNISSHTDEKNEIITTVQRSQNLDKDNLLLFSCGYKLFDVCLNCIPKLCNFLAVNEQVDVLPPAS